MTSSSPLARLLSWSPALAAMSVIFWLSSLPGDSIDLPGFRFSDKAVHFLAYAAMGILIGSRHALRRRLAWGAPEGRAAADAPTADPDPFPDAPLDRAGAAAGILFGLSDEIHQMFVPLREATAGDFVADALGILAGLYVVRRFGGRVFRRLGAARAEVR